MTRSVLALARADFAASLRFNPGGVLFVMVLIAIVVFKRRELLRSRAFTVLASVFLAGMWVWNLTANPTFN